MPTAIKTAVDSSSCVLPQPKMGLRMDHRRLGSSSKPTKKSMSTTPNSATCKMASGSATNFMPQGPIKMPAAK